MRPKTSVYNGHLLGSVTRIHIAERLEVELSLPVFTTYDFCGLDSNTQWPACEANAITDFVTAAVKTN